MKPTTCFAPAHILLPSEQVPLEQWGCIACDQFTSDRSYWQRAKETAAGAPSTLNLILPEVYLEDGDADARVEKIHATMQDYAQNVLTRAVDGFIYVERTEQSGRVRQGLVGRVDLEAYSYRRGEKCTVRPSECTVESRIPPRMKVRTGAALETPHIMMLADDPDCTLIEPIAAHKDSLPKVYEGELMLGGGHVAGWAVEDPALIAQIENALTVLGSQEEFDKKYPDATRRDPLTLAVGDGNHSLATAKACWEELKKTLTPEQAENHPARWCLAEVCNVHSPAIEIEPIAAHKDSLPKVYEGELMLGGGHVAGWAVEDPALIAQIENALTVLGSQEEFDKKYPDATRRDPLTLAVGDGNHSLATAKACWEELKKTLTPEQAENHPARWCLAEVCNVHSPAIEIEPIHRVLFNVDCATVLLSLITWSDSNMAGCCFGGSKKQPFTLAGPHMANVLSFEDPTEPLTVGTIDDFISDYIERHPEAKVDYVHDEPAVRALCKQGAVAFLMPPFAKSDLFRGVVMGGVLPRKTFSMGHAEEKRYYIECRKITE